MEQKLNGFCEHGNPALDCEHCRRDTDKYFAKKYPAKTKKILPANDTEKEYAAFLEGYKLGQEVWTDDPRKYFDIWKGMKCKKQK